MVSRATKAKRSFLLHHALSVSVESYFYQLCFFSSPAAKSLVVPRTCEAVYRCRGLSGGNGERTSSLARGDMLVSAADVMEGSVDCSWSAAASRCPRAIAWVREPLVCSWLAQCGARTSSKRRVAAPIVRHSISVRPQRVGHARVVVRPCRCSPELELTPSSPSFARTTGETRGRWTYPAAIHAQPKPPLRPKPPLAPGAPAGVILLGLHS